MYLLAFTGSITFGMYGITAGLANGLLTVNALPAIETELLTLGTTGIMPKVIVTGTAKGRAGRVVVGNGALHPDAVGDPRIAANMVQGFPLWRR